MDRKSTLKLFGEARPLLQPQFGVKRIAHFGSLTTGEATLSSDLDVLVDFEGNATAKRYFRI